ncbi:hypothetical protein GALMADRAFT_132741 [Galerina marginata CBS 339.88]|uniref:Uncharacterized protein n=1 Tax=Galerina marginata (strain CBS 339.88) TaxID=685588 RepID=A0A067TSJ8_GALM3|nr:hypothetical protein GALMADRAFT_132741 [Galerina marginata CBS 339.88]
MTGVNSQALAAFLPSKRAHIHLPLCHVDTQSGPVHSAVPDARPAGAARLLHLPNRLRLRFPNQHLTKPTRGCLRCPIQLSPIQFDHDGDTICHVVWLSVGGRDAFNFNCRVIPASARLPSASRYIPRAVPGFVWNHCSTQMEDDIRSEHRAPPSSSRSTRTRTGAEDFDDNVQSVRVSSNIQHPMSQLPKSRCARRTRHDAIVLWLLWIKSDLLSEFSLWAVSALTVSGFVLFRVQPHHIWIVPSEVTRPLPLLQVLKSSSIASSHPLSKTKPVCQSNLATPLRPCHPQSALVKRNPPIPCTKASTVDNLSLTAAPSCFSVTFSSLGLGCCHIRIVWDRVLAPPGLRRGSFLEAQNVRVSC